MPVGYVILRLHRQLCLQCDKFVLFFVIIVENADGLTQTSARLNPLQLAGSLFPACQIMREFSSYPSHHRFRIPKLPIICPCIRLGSTSPALRGGRGAFGQAINALHFFLSKFVVLVLKSKKFLFYSKLREDKKEDEYP